MLIEKKAHKARNKVFITSVFQQIKVRVVLQISYIFVSAGPVNSIFNVLKALSKRERMINSIYLYLCP